MVVIIVIILILIFIRPMVARKLTKETQPRFELPRTINFMMSYAIEKQDFKIKEMYKVTSKKGDRFINLGTVDDKLSISFRFILCFFHFFSIKNTRKLPDTEPLLKK